MTGKTFFITGASSGFGAACSSIFNLKENRLILAARRMDKLLALKSELNGVADVHLLLLDVRDREAVAKALESLPEKFRSIDVLINNAGLALGLEAAHLTNLDDWDTMVDTNIKGLMYCTRLILPGMVLRGRGHIVNIGSVAGTYPYPGASVYGATKAFVEQFSLNLRCDLLGSHVRVSCIEPGMAETEFSKVRFSGDVEKAAKIYAGVEALSANDIAEAVAWVVSRPAHVNINTLEVMPVNQAWNAFAVHRN